MSKVQVVVTVQSPSALWNIRMAQINCSSVQHPGNSTFHETALNECMWKNSSKINSKINIQGLLTSKPACHQAQFQASFIHLTAITILIFQVAVLLKDSQPKFGMHLLCPPIWFYHPNNTRWPVETTEFFVLQHPPFCALWYALLPLCFNLCYSLMPP